MFKNRRADYIIATPSAITRRLRKKKLVKEVTVNKDVVGLPEIKLTLSIVNDNFDDSDGDDSLDDTGDTILNDTLIEI